MKQYSFLRKIALAVAFGFGSLVALAQAPVIQWDKTFGGDSTDMLRQIVPTMDSGYILGGYSESNISTDKSQSSKGGPDYWIVKVDASGNKQWDKTLGGNSADYLTNLAQTSDGGYILGGDSYSSISGDKTQISRYIDYWIIKLDASGNKVWDKTFGGNSTENFACLIQTSDGGYILGGTSTSGISPQKSQPSQGGPDYWIVKIDASGNKLWDRTFGGSDNDWLAELIQTPDGGFILGGRSNSGISGDKTQNSFGSDDYWVLKLDANGLKQWDKTFGGSNSDNLLRNSQIANGGFILGGNSHSGISGVKTHASIGGTDYWLIALDSNGNKIWDKTFGGNLPDNFKDLAITSDGGYILGGYSGSGISGDKSQASFGGVDFWIIKVDAIGNKIWDKSIGGSDNDDLSSVKQTADGGYILGGYSGSGISGNKTQASKGFFDYWIVKLGPDGTTGINESSSNFTLSIFPNPSQGKFQLQFNNLPAKIAAITVSDLVGRIVYQQEIPVTGNQIQQAINLPAVKGMYLLQVKAGIQTTTRKIVIE